MAPGEVLVSGDRIMSPDSQSTLTVDRDGGLRLRSSFSLLWEKFALDKGQTKLIMQTDGNLVLYDSSNSPIWASNTVRVPDGLDYISTAMKEGVLYPGQNIATADRNYWLALQTDGNLVLYSAKKGAVWSTGTSNKEVSFLALQTDGNLVLYSADYRPIWASNTDGRDVQRLIVQPDGNLVLYRANGTPVWATNTVQR